MPPADILALQIARLGMILDARDSFFDLAVPCSYQKFLTPYKLQGLITDGEQQQLVIQVRNGAHKRSKNWGHPLCITEIWELWQDDQGNYIFISPRQSPPRHIIIDPRFTLGTVVGNFSANNGKKIYPLSSIDIRIIANWLACSADLILHAAGIAFNNKGYCFIGTSGAGKSTLSSALINEQDVTLLGEDQVILRYIDEQFWIFGTPWHENPDLCSPIGVPLEKLFFLDRNRIQEERPLSVLEGVTRLLQTAFVPYYLPEKMDSIIQRLTLLVEKIPSKLFQYKLGSQILPVIINA